MGNFVPHVRFYKTIQVLLSYNEILINKRSEKIGFVIFISKCVYTLIFYKEIRFHPYFK